MKSASHHAMGHLLYETLAGEGIRLDRELFVLGNLLPDYLPELILSPHFTAKCQREISAFSLALAGQPLKPGVSLPPEYSLRLGILCHYICDYFTFAHDRAFHGGLKKHAAYEQALDDCFRGHYTARECRIPELTAPAAETHADAARFVFSQKRACRAGERTPQGDIRYGFTVCLQTIRGLVALSYAQRLRTRAKFRFLPFAAGRYSYLDGVSHRRIVPRRAWYRPAAA